MGAIPFVLHIQVGTVSDECALLRGEVNIGRQPDNDVVLEDAKVSGRHAKLVFTPQQLLVLDIESRNGTRLNGQPLAPHAPTVFRPGDVIQIGPFALSLRPAGPAPAPMLAAERVRLTAAPQPGVAVLVGGKVTKHLLEQTAATLGRAPDNTIVIEHPKVSGRHARLEPSAGGYLLTDLGSANGTYCNGQRVQSKLLADGEVFAPGSPDVAVQFRAHIGFLPVGAAESVKSQRMPLPQTVNLEGKNVVRIGRASDNDIALNHPQISRYHAQLERMGGRYRLTDLKSANGVFLNGKKVEKEAWPSEGDEIRIGPYRLVFAEDGIRPLADQGMRLDIFGLQKWVRPDLNLLQDIYLGIQPQEFVALVGMSGAGKSTFMDAVNGFRPATHGVVLINGEDLYRNFDMYRNDMGYVPQKDIVHKELTVYDALTYAARLRMPADTTPQDRHERVLEVINELGLTERKDLPIHRLSGGQLKRVSIGVELITEPRLFFLDEPTSGLDPGTEYSMMRLLRRLADQGRTIMLITHATKNVMLCDKVIILVRGGYLAYYGPPEEALPYFDQYRTVEEKRIKDMEFDDIYTILEDEQRGMPVDWDQRYKQTGQYRRFVVERLQGAGQSSQAMAGQTRALQAAAPGASGKRVSALQQFGILCARNLKIMTQDKKGLLLMAVMPMILGLMDIIWGVNLFDPVKGNPTRAVMMLFVTAVVTMMAGALSSVYEIVKEADIYKRERAINLKILPYVLSKAWVGILLALYQAAILMLFKVVLVIHPGSLPAGDAAYLPFYVTLFLGTFAGYMTGLAISASVPKAEQAMLLLIIVVIAEIVFSGALLPLPETLGHQVISPLISNRWVVEGLINLTGLGDPMVDDPCWGDRPREGAKGWNVIFNGSEEEKRKCDCMGAQIFEECRTFPGVLDPDFFTDAAQDALDHPSPPRPEQPTPYPSPTPLPTYTPEPTPTAESGPQPQSYQECMQTLDGCQDQGAEKCEEQIDALQEQQEAYSDEREEQLNEYSERRDEQGDEYEEAMTGRDGEGGWAARKQDWAENRQKAISNAEGLLKNMFESYGYAFQGQVYGRWAWLSALSLGFLLVLVFFQKRKDTV